MNKIGLIVAREYVTRVKKKSFILMTLLGPLLLAGVMALVIWIGLSENNDQRILVIDDTHGAFRGLENGDNYTFFYMDELPIDEAKNAFKD